MADSRFFTNGGPFTIAELVAMSGATLRDESKATAALSDVAALDRACATDLSFFDNVKYLEQFTKSAAGACFVRPKYADQAPAGMVLLLSEDPYRCYAVAAQKFYPQDAAAAGVHASATIHPTAQVAATASIGAGVVIGAKAEIGEAVVIGANTVIGQGVVIDAGTHIGSLCTITHSLIGKACILHRGIHIGQDGFGFALGRGGHIKVPQLGRVIIGDHVEIGSGTTIDRGAGPDTIIGAGTKIDNLVQIGHNVTIGKGAVIVAQTGISGSTRIGDGAVLAGQSGVAGHLTIGAGSKIAAQSGVMHDIPPGSTYGGSPAVPALQWHKQTIAVAQLSKKRGKEE